MSSLLEDLLGTYDPLLQFDYCGSGDGANILRIQIPTQQARRECLSHRILGIGIRDFLVAQQMVESLTQITQSCSKFKTVQK